MRARTPRRPGLRRATSLAALALVVGPAAAAGSLLTPSAAAAPPTSPSLRLFSTSDVTQVYHRQGVPAYASPPVYAAPVGGTLDLRVSRADYADPFTVTQVLHDGGTTTRVPSGLRSDSLRGMRRFFHVTLTDPDGEVLVDHKSRFCPNSWGQQRIDPDGSDRSTFPDGCYALPLALGTVWGIDAGWATPALPRDLLTFTRNGRYTLTVTIRPRYRTAFAVAPGDASVSTVFRVRTGDGPSQVTPERPAPTNRPFQDAPAARLMTDPPSDNLPDLRSLPAFGIRTQSRHGKDLLAFGANLWVGGASLLDIEGFRRADEPLMDAYQYFYDGSTVVGKAPVGTMEYDVRHGHHHWHLLQFGRYRLLDSANDKVAKSKKQSWCIVPTDPIDLSLDGAERRPYQTGLDSACGGEDALWIRETLPVGWGDTYYQSRAGQAFDITDVPNGTYSISVEANPTGELFESDTTNNQSLREVVLSGRAGHRKVCVPEIDGVPGSGSGSCS